jgi:sugar O-acyltransferase (sialic acid O-acetyltransferase NeuD family)
MAKSLKKILIIGAGGHSKVVVDIIIHQKMYEIIGFIDNNLQIDSAILGYKVLGKEEDLLNLMDKFSISSGIVAIGDNAIRSKVVERIKKVSKDFKFINCIHPNSNIAFDVEIGEGNVVMSGATINTSSKVGDHCILNTNSSIDHDNKISNFVSIAPNSVSGGNVTVNQFSAIGIGATIQHKVSIGSNCIIGAHSLVNKDTKPDSVYFGLPAKYIRKHIFGNKYL